MIKIKTPKTYINEPDILKKSGQYVSKIGNFALIIGGKKALKAAGGSIYKSFDENRIKYKVEEYSGYCTLNGIDKYSDIAEKLGVKLLVGVGGGKIMDITKAVGEKTSLPVVTVPTIAATCAAWSALSILYNYNGEHTEDLLLKESPKLILADTKIIAKAPIRYLNAGIGDTIVKWHEAVTHLTGDNDITLQIGLQVSKLALDILKNYSDISSEKSESKEINQQYKDVIDSVIILAGLVGSVNCGKNRAAVAHAVNDSMTHISDTKNTLHGEKVVFGLIVQFILQEKSNEEIEKLIDLLNKLKLPVTLGQLRIKDDIDTKVSKIAEGVNYESGALKNLKFKVNSSLIKEAIIKADKLGNRSLVS